jgi:hypothetical protein
LQKVCSHLLNKWNILIIYLVPAACCVRTVPREDNTNGFFVACFERIQKPEVLQEVPQSAEQKVAGKRKRDEAKDKPEPVEPAQSAPSRKKKKRKGKNRRKKRRTTAAHT